MGKIIAIGGGEIGKYETLAFDREIVALTGKKHPKALFIPTASGEAPGYIETFNRVYGKRLGCKTDALLLLKRRPDVKELKEKVLGSDLVYVGGGNTLMMMRRWRAVGLDKVLLEAYSKGVVLSGLSAGSICWFEYGHSDSVKFYHPDNWDYIKVKGLGLIKGINCPHFSDEERRRDFSMFMKKHAGVGIAIDSRAALEVVDGNYRVLTARNGDGIYRIYRAGKRIVVKSIPKEKELRPLIELYKH